MVRRYTPEAGDIVWLHFDPQAGHEQAGHRPALVVSPSAYNGKTGLMLSEISLGGHWRRRDGGRVWSFFAKDEVPEDVARNRIEVVGHGDSFAGCGDLAKVRCRPHSESTSVRLCQGVAVSSNSNSK